MTANPKQIYGDKKVPMQLVPPALEIHAAKSLGEGAPKYGPYNWRQTKVEAMTYVGAMKRHLAAYIDGEDIDPESSTGKLHLDGIAGSLAILLDAQDGGFLIDNRPPPGPAPRLVLTPKDPEPVPTAKPECAVIMCPPGTPCIICDANYPKERK